jgi:cell division protein ZapA
MSGLMGDRVRVSIFGREYEMDPGGLTPLEVQSLAAFVDERMREISDRFAIVDTQKIAVLASINIALDYIQLKDRTMPSDDPSHPRLEALSQILDKALAD